MKHDRPSSPVFSWQFLPFYFHFLGSLSPEQWSFLHWSWVRAAPEYSKQQWEGFCRAPWCQHVARQAMMTRAGTRLGLCHSILTFWLLPLTNSPVLHPLCAQKREIFSESWARSWRALLMSLLPLQSFFARIRSSPAGFCGLSFWEGHMSSIAVANMSCMFYVFLLCVKCNILYVLESCI